MRTAFFLIDRLWFVKKILFPADSLAVFHIDTGDAAGQVAHDFIINRTADLSNFFNGNEAVALLAEEDDFITSVDVGFAADVDHALVHADRPDLRDAVTVIENVDLARQDTGIPVGIAYG